MIMLDRWEALAADGRLDKHTVEVCQALASDMCSEIFYRLGLDVQPIENALRVSGRGLTYLFPTLDKSIPMKSLDPPRIRLPAPLKPAHKGRPRKKFTGASADD
jgi:hypothetical protein